MVKKPANAHSNPRWIARGYIFGAILGAVLLTGIWLGVYLNRESTGRGIDDNTAWAASFGLGIGGAFLGGIVGAWLGGLFSRTQDKHV